MPESYKEDGRPAQQWYWDDWFSAFDVRLCSVGARGVWIDMLGIMYKAEIRGTLTINGRQIDSKTLAKIVGETMANTNKYLRELEDNDVFSRLEDNTIICRRMFRESGRKDQISKIRSLAGIKGAETRWQPNSKEMAKMAASSPSSPSSASSKNKKDTKVSFMSSTFKNNIILKWNELAQKYNLPAITEIKSGSLREKNLRARSADKKFNFTLLVDMIDNSPFLLGKTGKNPFFVFFDWIIKPTNYQKIMEGNYLDRQSYQKFSGIIDGIKDLKKQHEEAKKNES